MIDVGFMIKLFARHCGVSRFALVVKRLMGEHRGIIPPVRAGDTTELKLTK